MLDAVQIFTKGGMILFSWSLGLATLKGNPVDALIRTCLLEERSGACEEEEERKRSVLSDPPPHAPLHPTIPRCIYSFPPKLSATAPIHEGDEKKEKNK